MIGSVLAITEMSPKERSQLTVDPERPWVRRDNVVVTDNLLTLKAPISMTAAGELASTSRSSYVSELVMVGAPALDTRPGTVPADACGEWQDPSSTISAGILSRSADGDSFSGYRTAVCEQRVYCLQR